MSHTGAPVFNTWLCDSSLPLAQIPAGNAQVLEFLPLTCKTRITFLSNGMARASKPVNGRCLLFCLLFSVFFSASQIIIRKKLVSVWVRKHCHVRGRLRGREGWAASYPAGISCECLFMPWLLHFIPNSLRMCWEDDERHKCLSCSPHEEVPDS